MAVTDHDSVKSTGKELLAEVIRQKCIYQIIKDGNADKFFSYVENVIEYCNGTYTSNCSLKVTDSYSHRRKLSSTPKR